jgi:hypothetical protein
VYNNSIIENRDLGEGYSTLSSGRGVVGVYSLYVGCTLRDGTQIPAGSNAPVPEPGNNDQGVVPEPPTPVEPPAFGFPGVTPRDFSAGIEIPIAKASPQTVPLASDVALYTYEASANETATLRVMRVNGDISIGISVINRETSEIIFIGGLPSSNNLSVELTFPSDGIYVFGLFRLDTVERSGTSGAVQISIE